MSVDIVVANDKHHGSHLDEGRFGADIRPG